MTARSCEELRCEARGDRLRVGVRVSPRASRTAVGGLHQGALKVKVTAPPVDGKANAAVIALLAKKLGVPKRDVTIASGQTGRDKTVEVRGSSLEALRALAAGAS